LIYWKDNFLAHKYSRPNIARNSTKLIVTKCIGLWISCMALGV